MFHPVSTFIGLRYLRGRSGDKFSRFVSYMSTAGITIGVMSLVTVLSVMNGFESQLKNRILGVMPQAIVSQQGGKTDMNADKAFIAELPLVTQVQPVVQTEAVIQSSSQLSAGLLIGLDPNSDDPIKQQVIAGRISHLEAGKYQVFIGHQLARDMDITIGDTVRIMVTGASQYTPLGRIPSQRLFTVAGIYNTGSDVDGQLLYTHIQDAGRLLKMRSGQATGWRLYFDDPFSVADVSQSVLPEGWQWQDWRVQRGELFQAVRMEKNMMGLMLGLIVGVAAFNIISALIMVVMEKQSEVAILKTQGMTDQQILSIFMVQGASSGVIGALVGGGLGIVLSSNINSLLSSLGIRLFAVGGNSR